MSTQSVGNGANPYYEGLHDAEDEQDMRNRLALVRERDTLRARLAAAEARANELNAMLEHCRDEAAETERMLRAEYANANARICTLHILLARYRDETPLGHQPHMIAHQVDKALGRAALAEGEAG